MRLASLFGGPFEKISQLAFVFAGQLDSYVFAGGRLRRIREMAMFGFRGMK